MASTTLNAPPSSHRRPSLGPHRLHIAFLEGSLEERALQFARRAARIARRDDRLVRFWLDVLTHILRGQLPGAPAQAVAGAGRLIDGVLVEAIWSRTSPALKAAFAAYARGIPDLGLGKRDEIETRLMRAHLVQDGLAVLTGLPLGQRAPAGPLGCSSLVALPGLTESGELLFGRNFDLVPHGLEEAPAVCVHRPDRGIPHVSIHHGGGFTPGITAVNAEGLCLGVHQNFTRAVTLRGKGVIELALDVIEGCDSLSSALDFLRGQRAAGGWTFVLGDARRGMAAAVEIDAEGGATLFPPRDFLAVANCYRTRKKAGDFAFSGAWREHNWSRLSLLNRSARTARGAMTPALLAAALGDHTDAYDHARLRALGNTVSAVHCVDTAIFAPGLDAVWVAVGHTPRNTSDGYVGLSLSALFEGRTSALEPIEPHITGPYREALRRHSQGCRVLYEEGPQAEAEAWFDAAEAAEPGEPIFRFMQGALRLSRGDAEGAAERFARCADEETSPYRAGVSSLMQGRALDVLGRRGEAQAAYRRVPALAEDVDPGLIRRAQAGEQRAFSAHKVRHLVFDTLMADVAS